MFEKISTGYYRINGKYELYREYRKATGRKGALGYVPGYYVWEFDIEDDFDRNLYFEGSFSEVEKMVAEFLSDDSTAKMMLNHYGNPITSDWLVHMMTKDA